MTDTELFDYINRRVHVLERAFHEMRDTVSDLVRRCGEGGDLGALAGEILELQRRLGAVELVCDRLKSAMP